MFKDHQRTGVFPPAFLLMLVALVLGSVSEAAQGQGNARDASLTGLAAGLPAVPGVRELFPGMPLDVNVQSPLGTLVGSPYLLVADLLHAASPQAFSLPGEAGALAVTPSMMMLVDTVTGSGMVPQAPLGLPTQGYQLALAAPAARSAGTLIFQAAVMDPSALNGLAVTSISGGRYGSPPILTSILGGSSTLAQFGYSLHADDLDGDGLPEMIIGAREQSSPALNNAGRVFIYTGLTPVQTAILDDPAPQAQSYFGISVTSGDLNGDGFKDIAVGARQADDGSVSRAGKVVVYFGPNYSQLQVITSPTPESRGLFGHRAVVEDFNGDGYDDLAVSAIGQASGGFSQAGTIDIFYGPSLGLSVRIDNPVPSDDAEMGYRFCAEDLDGDGIADLVAAAPFMSLLANGDSSGALFILKGPNFSLDTYFPNPSPSAFGLLGADVACGDLNDDGFIDVIGGAELSDSGGLQGQGSVWILDGPSFATTTEVFSPQPAIDGGFGAGTDVGDFNGDGFSDLMVGEWWHTGAAFRSGRAHILYGPDLLTSTTVIEPTTGSNYQFGRRVRSADLNNDGKDEMLVGVPLSSAAFIQRAGAVYIVEHQ